MKKGAILGVLILILIITGIILIINKSQTGEIIDICKIDSDCVPAGVCHSSTCTIKANAPNTTGIFCTAVCEPGTLDCGQGECKCIKSKCAAVFK